MHVKKIIILASIVIIALTGCRYTKPPRPEPSTPIINQPAPKGTDIIGSACYIVGAKASTNTNVKLTCKSTDNGNRWLVA